MAAITRTDRARRAVVTIAMAFGAATIVLAHDPGLSALDVQVEGQQTAAVLSLSAADAALIGGAERTGRLALDSIELQTDGRPVAGGVAQIWIDENRGVHARLVYQSSTATRLTVRSSIPVRLPPGHRQLLSIRSQDGRVIAQRMLDARLTEVTANVAASSANAGSTAVRFIALGVAHILTGYDHLLFLAAVLVVIQRWRDVIHTITAFTVAHSITLALATFSLVDVPGRIVEPLIAASIVYVGVENLVRTVDGSRWKVTFGFGLIHGLGFATALRDLGIGASGSAVALPLASFNAGVEVGQIAVALVLVPLCWKLSATPRERLRFATAGSLLVVVAGAYWMIERLVSSS
jgi:hydrogenase/urease accessory protein HupE